MGAPNTTTTGSRTGAAQVLRSAPRRAAVAVRGHFRSPGRPRVWFELVLIAVSYWVYSLIRNAVPEQEGTAQRNALHIHHLEQTLGIAVERSINHGVNHVTWLIVGMNYYYATLHFVFTIWVLVWLFRWHPGRYAAARTVLFATTALALIGFYFFPLAPPRLMHGGGFIDTGKVHETWGSLSSGNMASVSNQFAAMPSMHIGWSMWVGLTIAVLARRRWVKALGVLYPLCTLTVIISTANHFFMDAVGGIVCLGLGFLISRLLYGRWAYRFPKYPDGAESTAAEERDGADGGTLGVSPNGVSPNGFGPKSGAPSPGGASPNGVGKNKVSGGGAAPPRGSTASRPGSARAAHP